MPLKVLLIQTVHNRKLRPKIVPHLRQAIASVQAQVYPNHELNPIWVFAVPIASVIKRMADIMRTPGAELSPLSTTTTAMD